MMRCGNMEESNKHWIEENCRICVLCGIRQDKFEHYVEECVQK